MPDSSSLPVSEPGRMPAEIVGAIEDYARASVFLGRAQVHNLISDATINSYARARAALDAAILSRLEAAEAWRRGAEEAMNEAHEATDVAYEEAAAAKEQLSAALARAERAETSRDAEAAKLADELEGWLRHGSYRPGDHLPSSWQHDLGGRVARNMRVVLRALRSCPAAALAQAPDQPAGREDPVPDKEPKP